MPLIKLVRKDKPATKRVTINLDFDTWSLLMESGEPRAVLESLVQSYCQEQLSKKEFYVVSNGTRVKYVDFGAQATEDRLTLLRESYAQDMACGKHQKATATRARITELERDLALEQLQEKQS